LGAEPDAGPSRTAIPKNPTIRFGAHRASVYGISAAAKIDPFAEAAKDPVREAHARDFIHKPVQPKIMDEELPDYQKLLDDMATGPTPVTMPDLPSLAATSTASWLKRARTLSTEGEGEFEDTGASGSGTHSAANSSGSTDPILPPPQGPTGQEDDEVPPELDRANVVTAFLGSSLLPEPSHLKMNNIATSPALAVDGPVQKAACKLLAPTYS